VALEPGFSYR